MALQNDGSFTMGRNHNCDWNGGSSYSTSADMGNAWTSSLNSFLQTGAAGGDNLEMQLAAAKTNTTNTTHYNTCLVQQTLINSPRIQPPITHTTHASSLYETTAEFPSADKVTATLLEMNRRRTTNSTYNPFQGLFSKYREITTELQCSQNTNPFVSPNAVSQTSELQKFLSADITSTPSSATGIERLTQVPQLIAVTGTRARPTVISQSDVELKSAEKPAPTSKSEEILGPLPSASAAKPSDTKRKLSSTKKGTEEQPSKKRSKRRAEVSNDTPATAGDGLTDL